MYHHHGVARNFPHMVAESGCGSAEPSIEGRFPRGSVNRSRQSRSRRIHCSSRVHLLVRNYQHTSHNPKCRHAGALCRVRSAGLAHFCNLEVWWWDLRESFHEVKHPDHRIAVGNLNKEFAYRSTIE